MKRFEQLAKKRFSFFEKHQDLLFEKIKQAQGVLYQKLIDYLLKLDTDAQSRIKNSTKNVKTLKDIDKIVQSFNKTRNKEVTTWIVQRTIELLGLNKAYFDEVLKKDTSVEAKARQTVMLKLGYDEKNSAVIEGGYLHSLANGGDLATEVSRQVNRAIASNMRLKDFQKSFKPLFVGDAESNSLGLLERHYYRMSYDLFQQNDRAIQKTYADELDLKYFIWAGTTIKTSTDFCQDRANRIFSKDFAEKWKNSNHKGKMKTGYDPLIDGHGYNCRFAVNWISDELAEELIKEIGLNKYN
jgi:hypothetical protein